jgi:DNA-binding transcriptional LysR family regulator
MKNADQISLRQLRCFVAVADQLHFRRAAEKLHMSQPPLTQRIRDMERDLKIELFRRSGNKVELTDAGRMVLKAAKETLAQAEGVYEAAQRAARGECGQVKVGLTTTALFFDSIQQAMQIFQKEHPGISLELTDIGSGLALECLKQRTFDVGLLRAFPASPWPACEEIVLCRDKLMLVLPAGHPQAHAKKIPLSTMVDEKFIALSCKRGTAIHSQVMYLWERSGLKPRVAQEASHGPAIMALVAGGLGYSILPSSFQAVRFERVIWKAIETDDRWTESSLNLVFYKDTLRERAPASFIECLRLHASTHNVIRQFG